MFNRVTDVFLSIMKIILHRRFNGRSMTTVQAGMREGVYASVSDEVERPTMEERYANPRASSAKLRWAVRSRE